jgi:protein-L-isoaspartate(D-aspartate) O-methyltransferase
MEGFWTALIRRCRALDVLIREAFLVPPSSAEPHIGRMQFLLDLRRRGIMDANVLRAMDQVPREQFVTPSQAPSAYADRAMPIACGQTISQPYVVAYMTEQLRPEPLHSVLEVGTGSGYQAAVLSRLVKKVTTIERYRTLAQAARTRLAALGYHNVEVIIGDGLDGAPDHAPFDRIIVTAAAEEIPEVLVQQLAVGGIMVLPLGPHDGSQSLVRLTRTGDGVAREDLIGVRFVPLLPGQAREL